MSSAQRTIRLGTRGSLLARTQSQLIASALEKLQPDLAVELVILKTQGDAIATRPLYEFGGKGLFTQELEKALLAGEIDFAVHSFKDVPITMPLVDQSELIVAAVPKREDPRDVLVSTKHKSIDDLPRGAKVGTGSLRRRVQLLEIRPDLAIEPVRGNIDTRLRKMREGQFDAIILASAGLRRAALFDEQEMELLPTEQMLPAAGQGALALQCRRGDEATRQILAALDDSVSQRCVAAERAVVQALNGDCHSPIAALAEILENKIMLRVAVGARNGDPPLLRAQAGAELDHESDAISAVIQDLERQGFREILAEKGPTVS